MYTYMDVSSTCIIPCMNMRTRATMRTSGVVAHGDTHQRARAQRVPSAFARPRVCDRATAPAQRNVDIDGANATYTPP